MGDYSPDPRFGDIPVNRRASSNPAPRRTKRNPYPTGYEIGDDDGGASTRYWSEELARAAESLNKQDDAIPGVWSMNNPSNGASFFPGKCGVCGEEYGRGEGFVVPGATGPRGGKVRAHAGCMK